MFQLPWEAYPYLWLRFSKLRQKYCFCLEGVQHTYIRIGVEHLIIVIFSVDELKFEELELLPSSLEFFLSLLKQLLQFLYEPHVFLLAGPIIEKLLQLIILFLHESNPLLILLNHSGKLLLHFLSPLNLFIYHSLDLLLLLSLQLLLPN